jgi:hypothetical protein
VGLPRESGLGAFAEEEGVVEDDGGRLSGVLVLVLEFFLNVNSDGIELTPGVWAAYSFEFPRIPSILQPKLM